MPLVLVTGASGRVGGLLTRRLRDQGHRVRALVHEQPVGDANESVSGDLLDPASLVRATEGADAVVHLAARTHARRQADYWPVNVDGTRNLVNAAVRAGARRFVFASTRAASASGGGYSASKLEAEGVAQGFKPEHVVVRLPEMLGVGASEGIADILERARSGRRILLVGDGSQVVYPVDPDDVVAAVAAAVTAPAAANRHYVLGGEPVTLREFAELCVRESDRRSRIVSVPVPVVRLASRAARTVPLPLYPDQFARLVAPKDAPTPEARADLGFTPRGISELLR
jgi:NADH dehydrogenase